MIETWNGDLDEASRNYVRAAMQPDFNLEWALADPDIAPLRDTPQFKAWLDVAGSQRANVGNGPAI